MIERGDYSESDWEGYEPTDQDLAYFLYEEEVFESMRLEYGEIEGLRRDHHKRTDRELRYLSKEAKSLAQELWKEYRFDVTTDSYEVTLDGEHYITMPRRGGGRDEVPRVLSRKDKRRKKTTLRKAGRHLQILMKRGRSPRQVKGYEDMSFARMVAAV